MPVQNSHKVFFRPSDEEIRKIPNPSFRHFLHIPFFIPSIALAISAGLTLLVPWCLVQVIDQGISGENYDQLALWLAVAVLSQALSGIFRFWGTCAISQYGLKLEKERLIHLYHRVMHADLRALPELSQGSAMGQMKFAASCERQFLETLYLQGVPLLITTFGACLALLTLSPGLAICSLTLIPISGLLWFWMKRRIRPAARLEYENQENLYRHLVDTFRAIMPIRALHQTHRFSAQFDEIAASCQTSGYVLQRKLAVQSPFFDVLQAIALLAIFGLGGYWTVKGELSLGALLGFQLYLSRFFGLLRGGTGIFGAWQHYQEGHTRAYALDTLPTAPEPVFYETAPSEVLRIENLSFSFDHHEVWQNKSLVIREGERHAILLPSGGGKTTLARCILGLYPISSGKIRLPGASSTCVGFVPQENVLFDGSLRENIGMMCAQMDDAQYQSLLYMCGLEPLEARLKSDSIGEQGLRLSGGEQRRVMLARALASNPRLLIIDQMASELEPDLCRSIFSRISSQMPHLGILYLGHRLPEWDF